MVLMGSRIRSEETHKGFCSPQTAADRTQAAPSTPAWQAGAPLKNPSHPSTLLHPRGAAQAPILNQWVTGHLSLMINSHGIATTFFRPLL
jgi:hypothetical protein